MKKFALIVMQACLTIGLTASFSFKANASIIEQSKPNAVTFFDVSDLPARIDEPWLRKSGQQFVLDCAVANRSDEQLLGIRLILMVIDPAGKLRSRITWTERAELAMYSIKTFAFHPELTEEVRDIDRVFLGIDEVMGRETIWRAAGVEKALRAYSRGQHDVVPTVRTFVNKYDPRPGMVVMPLLLRKP
jgi:hypothetical protein